jgi:putative hydrolase of the HAD superfamily
MRRNYELIIFDLGNVLLTYDHRITCRKLSKLTKNKHSTEEIHNFLFNKNGFARRYDEGKITSEEFFRTLTHTFALNIDFQKFMPIWNEIFSENKAISQIVRCLKKRHKIYLISNTNEMHFDYLIKRFNILTVFDKIFPSYALGIRKPKSAIFELALNTAKVEPTQTIFIDDIKEHIESASRLGIKGILFTNVEGLKKQLATLGVLN